MKRSKIKKPRAKAVTAKRVQAVEDKPFTAPDVEPHPEIDDDEPVGSDGLNQRRRAFVEYITGEAMNNATLAAQMAGYASENRKSLNQTASRLLTFVKVQEAIAERLAARRISNDFILHAVADVAGSSMSAFLSVGPDGKPVMDWTKAAANGAIGHVREYREEGFEHGGAVTVIKRTFKIYDRTKALELLAKLRGMLSSEPEVPERAVRRRQLVIGDAGDADHN